MPREILNPPKPVHLLVCIVDHFEPANGNVCDETQGARLKAWVEGYPAMADRHHDADGKTVQHTWFYPPHHNHIFLRDLVSLCIRGYGEIEMHLHHNHMKPFPDSDETLRRKILQCIRDYEKHGIFCCDETERKFAFIHGDWSLANACGEEVCGVNNEVAILRNCGCFADFTFPSLGKAQPRMVNKIYYPKSCSTRPKSYSWGVPLRVGGLSDGRLLMIPGIIGLRWKSRRHSILPSIEASNLGQSDEPTPDRIDYLVRNAIRISGRPEWRFIKLHTHGAREEAWNSLFGEQADQMFTYLESEYNDGKRYILHYVTAREMYNIAKAAEAGMSDNPANHRDYETPRYRCKLNN
ncbi:MAG: hypothetical protein AB2L12_00105 [Smithellaceae bacterium]